jgi:autotransporter-associated beta strand protein/T5SS/PEP-CTERM-associated repeat protein
MTTIRCGRKGTKLLYAALLGTSSLVATPAAAQDWVGASSGSWNDPLAWSPNGVPTSTGVAVIDNNNFSSPIVDDAETVARLTVADTSIASLTIKNGGHLTVRDQLVIANTSSSGGGILLTGANNSYANIGDLALPGTSPGTIIGNLGNGAVSVLGGAAWSDKATVLGAGQTGIGKLTVDGAGSTFESTGLIVGDAGQGTVNVTNDGKLTSDFDAYIGNQATAKGVVNVSGLGASYDAFNLTVGNYGSGAFNLSGGGQSTIAHTLSIGVHGSPSSLVSLDGAGTVLVAKTVDVGEQANSTLTVTNAAQLQVSGFLGIGLGLGTNSTLTASGKQAYVQTYELTVGNNGVGEYDLKNSAIGVATSYAVIGNGVGSKGTLSIDSTSAARFDDLLMIGKDGIGTLRDNGLVNSYYDVTLGDDPTASGAIVIDGGIFNSTGLMQIGVDGQGQVSITNHGQLDAASLVLGANADSSGVLGMGQASAMTIAGDITVGAGGVATLTVADLSSLRADGGGSAGSGTIYLAKNAGSTGLLLIGSNDATPEAPGTVDVAKVEFGDGAGTLEFNHDKVTGYNFDAALDGGNSASRLLVEGGVTMLSADSSGYKGNTLIAAQFDQAAGLVVNGKLGGSVTVGAPGISQNSLLAGSGTILGPVTVTNKGFLFSDGTGTLTMGSLTLDSGGTIYAVFGAPNANALFKVTGDLTLDGTLDIENGTLGQGLYHLFNYGGTLTDNGLDLGTLPNGVDTGDVTIQTAIAGQVNVVYSTDGASPPPPPPPPVGNYDFWDGDAAGNAGNGKIDGGGGTWTATSTNFTDPNGIAVGTYDPAQVIFAGQAGLVTTSNADGALHFGFLQFANDQFEINGEAIALDPDAADPNGPNPNAVIYVGDHTAQGASYVETIDNALTGTAGLTKDGLGTLVLNGANTYSGGTVIKQGTLALGDGAASIVGNVDDEGNFAFYRQADYTFDGVISGAGQVNSFGDGTLTFTAANTYTGATGVGSGTLALTGNGSIAASSGLYLEFATFDISGVDGGGTSLRDLTGSGTVNLGNNNLTITNGSGQAYYGAIQGAGGLHVANGQMTLDGDNRYTGGTIIDANGRLVIGDGGTTGSITGNVVDNGVFAFSRSDDVTFAGNISGSGVFGTEGAGSITLTGTNSYGGGTLIFGTTVIGDTKSLQGDIQSTGHLVFNQAFDGGYAGTITGTGDVTKSGAGTLSVTKAQGYTGATTINGGGLVVLAGLPGSDVTLNGGFLGGYGPVKSLTVTGGILSPGQSPGTMIVLGDASLGAKSTYAVDLAGIASDHLIAGGKVMLSGGTLTLNGTPIFGVGYAIIQAKGGVTGTFGTVSGGVAKPFEATLVDYQPDAVVVTLALDGQAIVAAGKTPNEKGAAEDVVAAPPANPVEAAIAGLDTTTAPDAFDQLSGEIHASLRGAIAEDARGAGDRLLETIGTRRGLWGEATIGDRRVSGDGNAATAKGSVRSVLVGVDGGSDTVRAGVTLGYGWDNVDVPGRNSSARMEALRVGGYLVAEPGNGIEFKAAGLYSRWQGDVSRSVSFTGYSDKLSSRDHADMLQGLGEIGWKAKAGGATIAPFGSLDWVGINGSAIGEKGGAAALRGQAQRQDSWFGKLGVRASTAIPSGSVTITPRASIAWERAFGDRLPTADLAFADSTGGSAYTVAGSVAPRDRANGEIGVDVTGRSLDIGISAGGSYANRTAQTDLKLHLRWQF